MMSLSYQSVAATASILSLAFSLLLAMLHPESKYFDVGLVVAFIFIFCAFLAIQRDHWNEIRGLQGNHRQEIRALQSAADRAVQGLFGQVSMLLHRLSHDLRDRLTWLIWRADAFDLSSLQNHAETTGQHICNIMADLLSYYIGKPIAVSIKIMDNATDGTEEVVTLARDQRSAAGRAIGDKHPVKGNTAFNRIRTGDGVWFAESDLIAESRAERYRNTNPDWQQKYQSAIVVPIRRENLNDQTKNKEKFWLLGFLCADAKEAGTFDKKRMDDYVLILMVASDAAYVYFYIVNHIKATISARPQIEEQGGGTS